MTATVATIVANYVTQHPGKAAKAAVQLLASPDEKDRARGSEFATALRSADRCCICGRALSRQSSIDAGIGDECRNKGDATRRALLALRAAGFNVADPDPPDPNAPEEPPMPATDLTAPRAKRPRSRKVAEGKPWEATNSDHSPNVGSYAVQAGCGMVDLAVELVVLGGRRPMERLVKWLAIRLLEAADEIQAGVRSDGRHERMDNSHSRARGVVHSALLVAPFPLDAVTDVGIVAPADADRVHQWHADVVNAGVALLQIAVDISDVDWRTAA